jgi:hypothetical protein
MPLENFQFARNWLKRPDHPADEGQENLSRHGRQHMIETYWPLAVFGLIVVAVLKGMATGKDPIQAIAAGFSPPQGNRHRSSNRLTHGQTRRRHRRSAF